MQTDEIINGLIDFIKRSPTPFHAVKNMASNFKEAGFVELKESDHWDLLANQQYYVIRNSSSIIAFRLSAKDVINSGIRMVGAHTDSPCLKVKPQPEKVSKNYFQLGVEVYGGVLQAPWFDRDLSIAGRVSYVTKYRQIEHALIDFKEAVACIPSLAIHLDREVNENRSINAQTQLPPVLFQVADDEKPDFRALLKQQLIKQYPESNVEELLDYELCFYDVQSPSLVGFNKEFLTGARLDNLLSCYIGMMSLIYTNNKTTSLLVCTDHEEVGSTSACGANGPFLRSVIERITGNQQKYSRVVDKSILISADNAHGVHPNFTDKHDDNHGPILNKGPVIKVNANQRYATNSETAAMFRFLCKSLNVPVQSFAMRSDMLCGSTIGPLTAGEIGVKTIDIGVPQFAMHSIRETAGVKDCQYLFQALKAYYDASME